jgi:hypothetical protein
MELDTVEEGGFFLCIVPFRVHQVLFWFWCQDPFETRDSLLKIKALLLIVD